MAPRKTQSQTTEKKTRFSARRKSEAVVRLLRGEDLDTLSRELKVPAARLSEWRDEFLAAGEAALKRRETDVENEQIKELKVVIGDLTMRNELLLERARAAEGGRPFRSRKPRS